MGIFDFLAAKDITEKYGNGAGYSYLKEQIRQYQQDNYNKKAIIIEENKAEYIKIVLEMYNQNKELFDKEFNDKFINIITTYSTSTPENIESVQLILDMIVNEMLLTITIKDIINQLKETIEKNKDNEKISQNQQELLHNIEEIENINDSQKAKQKLIDFLEISNNLGIKILNKEELIKSLNN